MLPTNRLSVRKKTCPVGSGIPSCLLIAGLAAVQTPGFASAEDASYCHDMPARESVLQEGQDYLRRSGDSAGRSNADSFDIQTNYFPLNKVTDNAIRSVSTFQIDTLNLDTTHQLLEAQQLAEKLECAERFESAERLYRRILEQREKPGQSQYALAEALESVARTEILRSQKLPLSYSEELSGWNSGPKYEGYRVGSLFMGRAIIRSAIKQITANNNLVKFGALYQRALSIRRNCKDCTEQLISDLLINALIQEKLNHTRAAAALYVEAAEHDSSVSKYLAAFIVNNKAYSLVQNKESLFTDLADADAKSDQACTAVLLGLYASQHDLQKLSPLLETTMNNLVNIPAFALIPIFNYVQKPDLAKLTEYIKNIWRAGPIKSVDLVTIIQAMEKKGWLEQAESVCQSAKENCSDNAAGLLVVAKCYDVLNKKTQSLALYQQIFELAEKQGNLSTDAVCHFGELTASLNSCSFIQEPEAKELLAAVAKQLESRKNDMRRRQCLEMTNKLNYTALNLEKTGQNAMAKKLYQEALDIKVINLGANDADTTAQMLDVARVCTEQHNYKEAQALYEQALPLLRKNVNTDPAIFRQALESYGEMLERVNQHTRADIIYAEAKTVKL